MHLIVCLRELFVYPGDFLHMYILYYSLSTPYVTVNMLAYVHRSQTLYKS